MDMTYHKHLVVTENLASKITLECRWAFLADKDIVLAKYVNIMLQLLVWN